MKLRDLFFEMSNSLLSSKLRTALTMTGLIIGIVSVIVMLAAVQGVENMVLDQMGGSRISVVSFSVWDPSGQIFFSKKDKRIASDIEYLKARIPAIVDIGINGYGELKIKNGKKEFTAYPMILDAISGEMNPSQKVAQGRYIEAAEFENGAPVMVMAYQTAKQLFDDPENAAGKTVNIGKANIEVVGVTPQGGMMGGGQDVIPIKTIERRIPEMPAYFGAFEVIFDSEESAKAGVQELKRVYTEKYTKLSPDDNMYTFAYSEMLNEVRQFTQVFSILALLIASTSLSVGGIGIMNMMLTNVTERTREIGLRKAVGAKASSITWQFLFEAIAVCLSGNLIAVIVSYAIVIAGTYVIPMVASSMSGFRPAITWWSLLISVGVSTFIALVFGWYPARRASKLDPIEALRHQ